MHFLLIYSLTAHVVRIFQIKMPNTVLMIFFKHKNSFRVNRVCNMLQNTYEDIFFIQGRRMYCTLQCTYKSMVQ